MELDISLLNTQLYKVRIKGKMEQSKEKSSALPYTSMLVAIEKGTLDYGRHLYSRMLRAVFNKSWNQYPIKQQLYNHLTPISQIIQERRTRHPGQCWCHMDELIATFSDRLLHQDIPVLTTSKNLHSSAMCGHRMPSKRLSRNDGHDGRMAWESLRNLYCQHDESWQKWWN